MKLRMLLGAVVLVASTALITKTVISQDQKGSAKAKPDADAQVEVFAQYAMAGKHHRLLNQMAGSWDTTATYWMTPDSPPEKSKGTCDRKWILDRRFLLEEFDGGSLGLPFQGVGIYGYDCFEQKYTSAWVDTMSTAIMNNLGVYDKTHNVVNFKGKYGDPWTGVKKKSRGVTRFINKDKHALELYAQEPDGREYKLLEIIYTRRPPAQEKKAP